jgi:hypothetical protein
MQTWCLKIGIALLLHSNSLNRTLSSENIGFGSKIISTSLVIPFTCVIYIFLYCHSFNDDVIHNLHIFRPQMHIIFFNDRKYIFFPMFERYES